MKWHMSVLSVKLSQPYMGAIYFLNLIVIH